MIANLGVETLVVAPGWLEVVVREVVLPSMQGMTRADAAIAHRDDTLILERRPRPMPDLYDADVFEAWLRGAGVRAPVQQPRRVVNVAGEPVVVSLVPSPRSLSHHVEP